MVNAIYITQWGALVTPKAPVQDLEWSYATSALAEPSQRVFVPNYSLLLHSLASCYLSAIDSKKNKKYNNMPNYLIEKDAQEKSSPLLISAHAMQHVSKERYDSVQNIYKRQ